MDNALTSTHIVFFLRIMKDLAMRIKEAVEIRSHIERLGILVDPQTRETLVRNMNAFVRDGNGVDFKLHAHDDVYVRVVLARCENTQSGITLLK